VTMDAELLIKIYPRLYHMAEGGSWASISKHGLLSTSALLDLFEYTGDQRFAVESTHRSESVTISHSAHGKAVVRDQKPMSDRGLLRSLQDGLTPREWYQILNRRVFFWTSLERLHRLLDARPYRGKSHDVLIVRTEPLVEEYYKRVTLSPINSGCTKPFPRARGCETFLPIAQYPYDMWSKRRPAWDAIVEVAVESGVQDIQKFLIEVVRMKGKERSHVIWKR